MDLELPKKYIYLSDSLSLLKEIITIYTKERAMIRCFEDPGSESSISGYVKYLWPIRQ
jgi:hypothetical protein